MAPARDGAIVPVSLVYRAPLVLDGERPALLYAYGAYGHIIEPTFSSSRLSLLDRGFVYAIAHVRGGQDMGRAWYDDGKMFGKMNTFFDFIDCAEFLDSEGIPRATASWRTAEVRAVCSWARSRIFAAISFMRSSPTCRSST